MGTPRGSAEGDEEDEEDVESGRRTRKRRRRGERGGRSTGGEGGEGRRRIVMNNDWIAAGKVREESVQRQGYQ